MRFKNGAGAVLGLVEAAALGRPEGGGGPFLPAGEDDLKPAVYSPESSYSDFAASAISALFPGDVDPMLALRLADRAFPSPPEPFDFDESLTVVDLCSGPSASSADPGAAFLGGILAVEARARGPRLVIADGSGPEGAALAEAMAGIEGLSLALLYPEGSRAAGIRPARLAREGGSTRLIAVRGGRVEVGDLIAACAGGRIDGKAVTIAGPSNPARFAARIIGFAAVFAALSKGATGEIYLGLRSGEGIGLSACLWAWRLGIPLTGAIIPLGEADGASAGIDAAFGGDPDGRALAARFEEGRPGLIRSLVRLHDVDRGSILAARGRLEAAGAPSLDLEAAAVVAAAERVLEQGLRGHAKVLVLSERHPSWSGEGASLPRTLSGAMLDARPDSEIGPSLGELRSALER
jgi:threonine synthase